MRDKFNKNDDKQQRLLLKLADEMDHVNTLEQAVDLFFDVVEMADDNDEERLLYEVGYFPDCCFCLVRQIPNEDNKYCQLHLEMHYDMEDAPQGLSECKWHAKGDEDLRAYVYQSEAFRLLKDLKEEKMSVFVDET